MKQDTVGWGIGNASASGLQSVGSHVPLQGGFTAMATVKPVMTGVKVTRRLSGVFKIKRIRTGLESTREPVQ
ncbi:hypothetical protein VB735_11150 [Halotia wernerae UHCC 0503]|nr:hypothetical protein [Halotia wernerae UHCC 0503]